MLDIKKRYAVHHTVFFGTDKVPHQLFAILYYCQLHQSFKVEEYLYSVDRQGRPVVATSVVWAGSKEALLDDIEVLHEWSSKDDVRFKASYDELDAKLHFKQGKGLQTSLF